MWRTAWSIIRDLAITGTGLFAIWREVLSATPNGYVLMAGLTLTVPSVAEHVKALLPSSEGPPTSGSSGSRGEQPPPSTHG